MEQPTKRVGVAALAVLGLALAACSDDATGPGEQVEPFVGTWFANELEFRPIMTEIPVRVDLVQQGLALTLEVRDNGRFVIVQGIPGTDDPGVDRGRIEVDERNARVTLVFDDGEPLEGSYFFHNDGTTLTLGLTGAEFDFNRNGQPAPARVRIVLEKDDLFPEGG